MTFEQANLLRRGYIPQSNPIVRTATGQGPIWFISSNAPGNYMESSALFR